MVFVKLFLGILLVILSLALGIYALIGEFPLPAILAVALLFPSIAMLPPARHRENIWMFVLATPTVIPLNIVVIQSVFRLGILSTELLIGKILWGITLYTLLFCIEQIILGVLTRAFWKRQLKSVFCKLDRIDTDSGS